MISRRTRIIATIGPATDTAEMIEEMINAGVNIFRLNMSHAPHDIVRRNVEDIRRISERLDSTVGILMDTQGPAIRTGSIPVELNLEPGDKIALTVQGAVNEEMHSVEVNYDGLVDDITLGDTVLIDNGEIQFKVISKKEKQLECEVLTQGTLGSRRHINLPGVRVNLPALTDKDIQDVELGIELNVDFFAMSFVREAKDVMQLKNILEYRKAPQRVIAKLEDQEGIRNLDDIIDAADGIMVARGDLGIEVPYEELPIIQRRIVKNCQAVGKPVIVATHMLESMIENPGPTRAEITDVANAVFEQADCIMLSGETSVGKYPLSCLDIMDRVARRTERSGGARFERDENCFDHYTKLIKAGATLAQEIDAKAFLVFTRTGKMALNAAWMRPRKLPIHAFTQDDKLRNQMIIHWGVVPHHMDFADDPTRNVEAAIERLISRGDIESGDWVVAVSEIKLRDKLIDSIQMEKA